MTRKGNLSIFVLMLVAACLLVVVMQPFNQTVSGSNAPAVLWEMKFAISEYDIFYSVDANKDGGFVLAGATISTGFDGWVARLDGDGVELWNRIYGDSEYDCFVSVTSCPGGGYVLAGWTETRAGDLDGWAIKLDENGNELWDFTLGGRKSDRFMSVAACPGGGYVLAGKTESAGAGESDGWVIKLDDDGNEMWNRTYGGDGFDFFFSVDIAHGGGYVFAGSTWSSGAGRSDGWAVTIDGDGNERWNLTLGSPEWDELNHVVACPGGGYLLSGYTEAVGDDNKDGWAVILDENGNQQWSARIGGVKDEMFFSAVAQPGGGYLLAGKSKTRGESESDGWLVGIDAGGKELWNLMVEGDNTDAFYSAVGVQGGYLLVGNSERRMLELSEAWVVMVESGVSVEQTQAVESHAVGLIATTISILTVVVLAWKRR